MAQIFEFRQRGSSFSLVFPLRDTSGNLVTGATGIAVTTSRWDEGATPPNLATYSVTVAELGAGAGLYRMTIPSADTAFDYLVFKVTATGAVPTVIMITTRYQGMADAFLDRASAVETNVTVRNALRIMLAALAGKTTGAGTSLVKFRNVGDSKDRITATIDGAGNRLSVTVDGT